MSPPPSNALPSSQSRKNPPSQDWMIQTDSLDICSHEVLGKTGADRCEKHYWPPPGCLAVCLQRQTGQWCIQSRCALHPVTSGGPRELLRFCSWILVCHSISWTPEQQQNIEVCWKEQPEDEHLKTVDNGLLEHKNRLWNILILKMFDTNTIIAPILNDTLWSISTPAVQRIRCRS